MKILIKVEQQEIYKRLGMTKQQFYTFRKKYPYVVEVVRKHMIFEKLWNKS